MAGSPVKERKDVKQRRFRQLLRWSTGLVAFVMINALLRLAILPINEAEYTDGILQVLQFQQQSGIWPPLYTALVWPFQFLIGPLWGGRLVSTLFSSAAVIPIFLLTRRSFGLQAAIFAALVYTVAPMSLRWSPRVMTDATFSFFFWFACERLIGAQMSEDCDKANRFLLHANIMGTLAALTRYQGMMLILPVAVLAIYYYKQCKFVPWKGLLSTALYGLVPAWSLYAGNIHGTQFQERAGSSVYMTALINGEAFLLLMPYFLTYPVAIAALIGLTRGRSRPRGWVKPLTYYVLIVLLIVQGAFGSFQERYMLPVAGLLFIWAGVGLAAFDNILRKSPHCFHHRLRPYAPIIVVLWSLAYSFLVLTGSRQAFGDLAAASRFAGENIEPQATIYTNEIYRPAKMATDPETGQDVVIEEQIDSTKVDFFSGKNAIYLSEEYLIGSKALQKGDILVLSTIYGAEQQVPYLQQSYRLTDLNPDGFEASILPIFPDLMAIPGTGQNITAWVYRYTWQPFETRVYRVEGIQLP